MPEKPKTLIERIIHNPIIQTLVIFVSSGWIILEITEYFIVNFGLNESARIVILIILLCLFPITIFLTWYLHNKQKGINRIDPDMQKEDVIPITESKSKRRSSFIRKPKIILPSVLIIIAIVISLGFRVRRQAKMRWAKEKAIPEIEQFFNEMNYPAAFQVALKAEKYIPEDPEFVKLSSDLFRYVTIQTEPPGADIYIKEYSAVDSDWKFIGKAPIDSLKMPVGTFYRWKMEKAGYERVVAVAQTNIRTLFRKLDKIGTIPTGMVRVLGSNSNVGVIPDFYIDKYEVTNKQFKEFLDAGGYQKQEYWKQEFIKDGHVLEWGEAMVEFQDKTGRPGPASWQVGDYPEGQDDYPVTGISWYEAAAYAEFMGKSLPTSYHWDIAAGLNIGSNRVYPSRIIPLSNFNGTGPVSVGSCHGLTVFGANDMAGNVREWIWNESDSGRMIKGGAWNDFDSSYSNPISIDSFDRSLKNGFRCVQYIDNEEIPETAFQSIGLNKLRDYYKEEPVSDEIFQVYKNQFQYDKFELEATVYEIDDSFNDWTIEKITFNAAYGKEHVIAYLYLPKNTIPPFQTVIYFPGSASTRQDSIKNNTHFSRDLDFFLKSGRAVMFPVYMGTFERANDLTREIGSPNQSHSHTEYLVKVVKDLSVSIDYLETRSDIDINKLAYFGYSWGVVYGVINLAVEERFKVGIFGIGGLRKWAKTLPEAEPINYVSHVTIPILMLNGRYDNTFPMNTSVIPMYNLLGTPEADKVLKVYETEHNIPKNELIKESLNWLDRYLGPVKKQ